jgi:CubicO group peptidase (beta-lactamase class C family)
MHEAIHMGPTGRGALVIGLVVLPAALPAQADPLAGLDREVTRMLADWWVPGAAIAVVRGDSVLLARGYGIREVGKTGSFGHPVLDRILLESVHVGLDRGPRRGREASLR